MGVQKKKRVKTLYVVEVSKPEPVIDYRFAQEGVDMSDSMSSYHTCLRKTKKLYRKLAMQIFIGTSSVNTWVLLTEVIARNMKILQIQENFVTQENIVTNLIHKKERQQPTAAFDYVPVTSKVQFLRKFPGLKGH